MICLISGMMELLLQNLLKTNHSKIRQIAMTSRKVSPTIIIRFITSLFLSKFAANCKPYTGQPFSESEDIREL